MRTLGTISRLGVFGISVTFLLVGPFGRPAYGFGEQFEAPGRAPIAKPKPKPAKRSKPKTTKQPKKASSKPAAPRYGHVEIIWFSGRKLCRGEGQSCSKTAKWSFDAPFDDDYVMTLEIPAKYCSPVALGVRIDGRTTGRTDWLLPGQSQNVSVGALTKGWHKLDITATGREGGCNEGRLESWGVDVLVKN